MLSGILKFSTSDVLARGIAVLFIPLFSYLLGPGELGQFSEWYSFFNLFAALAMLGVPSYVLVLLSRDEENARRISGRVLRFQVEWWLILGFANLVFWYLAPNWLYGLGLFLCGVFYAIVNYVSALLRHYNRLGGYVALQLALVGATSLVPLILVVQHPAWQARSQGILVGLGALTIVILYFAGQQLQFEKISRAFRGEAFSFGISLALMAVFTWLKLGADVQILKYLSGYDSGGILFFAFQVVSIVSIVAASLNRSASPTLFRLLNQRRRSEFSYLILRLAGGLILLALVVTLIAILLVEFILLEFRGALFMIYPMVVGAVLYGTAQFLAAVFLYSKKAYLLTWCICLSSMLHPLLSYLVVSRWSWQWIGWSYLVSSLAFFLLVFGLRSRVEWIWKPGSEA